MNQDKEKIYRILIGDRDEIYERIEYHSKQLQICRKELRTVYNAILQMEKEYGLKEKRLDDD